MLLARTFASNLSSWELLRKALSEFGSDSGLFKDIEIRRWSTKERGPFQIRIKVSGTGHNLVDVGYGVSQVLPVLVESIKSPNGATILLQQPEVHLHPKAQASLGSVLLALSKSQNKTFIVETHSDYLVDRIRMDVRDNEDLSPSDVSILFFERKKGDVIIHPISIDKRGNMVGAPRAFRRFFLEEEKRFLLG
ncbi:AAA family ATPase [Candidatus Acetothermia bacterium]|nr:AAA family ATPase [Candidatus Acetothermia bacterium]MBI3642999.1 AAA family ATPase [Candidatus Acetothermia bacterium]